MNVSNPSLKRTVTFLGLVATLFAGSASVAKTPVIFDTDMAIDDWSALLFMARHPDLDLLTVTVAGSGESHCEPGVNNILSLLDLTDVDPDVTAACGDPWPLDGYFVFPVAWQNDMDILSGVPVEPSDRTPYNGHAVELIHETIAASDEPVVIIATGPMTNIAQWLEKYPDDRAMVSRLVIMGGSLEAPGNIIVPGFTDANPNKDAEWNLYIDPPATEMVLRSAMPIELVGLDVTNTVKVTQEFAAHFKSVADNPAANFWDAVLDKNGWFIDSGEYYFWDVLAAIIVADPSFCEGPYSAVSVGNEPTATPWMPTSDMTIPETRWDGQPRQHLNPVNAGVTRYTEGQPKIKVCLTTRAQDAFDLFVDVLIDTP